MGPAPVFSLAVMTMNIVTVLSAEIPLTDAPAYNTKSFKSGDFHSSVTSLDLNPSGPCTFENDQCRWTDVSDGQSKWQRQRASNNTEPPTDHTADTGGCY